MSELPSNLLGKFKLWREKPQIFVREVFRATPDTWQDEVLADFPHNQRQAMKACKGPGKSTVLSWLAWNFLLTRPHPKIAAVSISGDNLRDGLWTEMAKWQHESPLLTELFQWQKERIFLKEFPATWFMSARNWPKAASQAELGQTLAGIHADYIMFLLDEGGGLPDAIMASAEGALSGCKEGHIVMAGNPTHLEGPLWRACTSERSLWKNYEITGDPDSLVRSSRVPILWARQQIEKYGRDNPWVLVNVFGQFPPSSLNALIGPVEVEQAIKRRYKDSEFQNFGRVLGIDVARYGDDSSIIFPRQGLQAFQPIQFRNLSGTEGADRTLEKWNEWGADGVFIDNTGGFGASWIDNLIRLGKDPVGVAFNNSAVKSDQFANKRAEMAFDLVDWIKKGGAIPDIPELTKALVQTTYTFKSGDSKMILEPKEDVKLKLGFSPDHMDALMLTFAYPVERHNFNQFPSFNKAGVHQIDYNPFSRDRVQVGGDNYHFDPRR